MYQRSSGRHSDVMTDELPPHAVRLCEEGVSTTYIKEKTKVSMCFIIRYATLL